jgi:transposase
MRTVPGDRSGLQRPCAVACSARRRHRHRSGIDRKLRGRPDRHLRAGGLHVVEVNQPHPPARARRGKTDAGDAEMAAHKVLSGEVSTVPKDTTGVVESIRQLKVARSGAIKTRSAALVSLGALIITAPAALPEQTNARSLPGRAAQAARLRPDLAQLLEPAQPAKPARSSLARQITDLDEHTTELDHALAPLVAAAPRTVQLLGIGTQHAAQLLLTIGQNAGRVHDEAAFAHLCGSAPSTPPPARPSVTG